MGEIAKLDWKLQTFNFSAKGTKINNVFIMWLTNYT